MDLIDHHEVLRLRNRAGVGNVHFGRESWDGVAVAIHSGKPDRIHRCGKRNADGKGALVGPGHWIDDVIDRDIDDGKRSGALQCRGGGGRLVVGAAVGGDGELGWVRRLELALDVGSSLVDERGDGGWRAEAGDAIPEQEIPAGIDDWLEVLRQQWPIDRFAVRTPHDAADRRDVEPLVHDRILAAVHQPIGWPISEA